MRRLRWLLVVAQATLVVGFGVALGSGRIPLGVRGEWEWPRLPVAPTALDLITGLAGVAGFAGFAWRGGRALGRAKVSRGREAAWVAGLVGAAVAAQLVIQSGAPEGYGLTKWA